MSVRLPDDLQVARELSGVRERVMAATRTVRSPRRSTRYRTTRTVVIAAAIAAALTAGALIASQVSDEQQRTHVTCYQEASLQARYTVFIATPDGEPEGWVFDPIELCGIAWRNESWGNTSNNDPDDPNDGDAPIPPLEACTSPDGQAAVFPREGSTASAEDFCATLGLTVWDSD